MAIFPTFFLGNIGQENFFYDDILKRKNAFLCYKNKKSKKSKNWYFFKWVNLWFCSKLTIFLLSFLGNIGQEKVLNNILQRKNIFLGYKKKNFNSRKIDIFPKGSTHGFDPIFQLFFFFHAIYPTKMSFTIFYNEKTPFYAIKTRSWKSRKIDIFLKRVKLWFWSKNGQFSNFFFLANIGQENFFYDILDRKRLL